MAKTTRGSSVQQLARNALKDALGQLVGVKEVPASGRVTRLESNLVDCMTVGQMRRATLDVSRGDGEELEARPRARPKLHSAWSSAALAVNAFACWRDREQDLRLGPRSGFESFAFEEKCRIFRGGRAPNLDLVARYAGGVVGVESSAPSIWPSQRSRSPRRMTGTSGPPMIRGRPNTAR